MKRAEDIKQILLDEDILRRVKEWIYSRDEMNQASVAAANDSKLSLMEVLEQLPIDEFEKMKQDLNLDFEGLRSKSPAAMAGGFSSGPKGGLGPHEVPPELNEQGIRNEVQEVFPHSIPERELSDTQLDHDWDSTLAEFKAEELTDNNKKKELDITDKEPYSLHLPAAVHKTNSHGNCSNGNMHVMGSNGSSVNPPDSLDQSGLRSQRTTNMPSQYLSQVHGPTDSGRTTINAVTGGQTRSRHEAEYALHGDSFNLSPYASDRHPVNGPQPVVYQHARVPTGQNATRPPGSQTARPSPSHNTIGAMQGPNFQPHDHVSHIPSETLHTIVSMLERELKRRDQPARCNTCANFESENKNLRKSNRSLGLQFEQLQWNYIKVQQDIKTLEENLIQKDQDIEENKRVIRYFHTIMVDRKKKIDKLKKEMDILRNKHKEELCQKLDKVVVKELEEKAQQKKQMKKQTEMMEEAYVKKVGTESELRKLNEKNNVLLKENESLKEENRQLKEELDASNAEVNGLRLRLQAQEEKIKEREEIDAIQEEFALREAQLKDRIDNEIQKLMQVYEDLKMYAVGHGLSLNLETKRECNDFPSP